MSQQTIKILSDIRIVNPRLELDSQALNKNDVKMVYLQRPRKSIRDTTVDPGDYSFDAEDPKKSSSDNSTKLFGESHYCELLNGNQAESEREVTENVFAPYCQTLPSKPSSKKGLKYLSKMKEPEKVNFMQKNTINKSKSSTEDIVEEEYIDLVEEDEIQQNLSYNNEPLHYRETSTPVTVSKSTDGNIVDVSHGKNKTRDLDNRSKTTLVKKVQDLPNNRKTSTTTKKSTADQTCPKVVWVSNVSHSTKASQLKDALSAHGTVIGAKVVVSARYPGSSCYGYVTMASNEDVDNVIAKLNNTELNGQIIKLGRRLNDKLTTETKSEVASENQGKETVSEREVQQSHSIERIRSTGKSRPRTPASYSSEGFKRRRSRSPSRKSGILTFAQIKEERERQKLRDQERALREASRRRQEEIIRQKDIDRRQRQEAMRLEKEKEKLRLEKEKIVREREELMKLEQERFKITQQKLELKKTLSRLERPAPNWVNDRKWFATGNRHLEAAAPPKFDYSASKSNSTSAWKLCGSSKSNFGKFRTYNSGNYFNKKCRNYNSQSGPTSSKYHDERQSYDYQGRTLHHRSKQNSGNVKQYNIHNICEESERNVVDLSYNELKSRLIGSSATPNLPVHFDKSD